MNTSHILSLWQTYTRIKRNYVPFHWAVMDSLLLYTLSRSLILTSALISDPFYPSVRSRSRMESLNQSGWVGPIPGDYNSSSSFGLGFSGSPVGNYTANVSDQSMPFQGSSTMITAVISFTVFIVGLTGNTLAIYVVLRYAKMKTVTNIYILNLAVADELYILGLPFLTTQNVLSYWPFGSFLCRVVMTADSLNQFTSIFCLTVMSIDRYLAVVHPIRSTRWRRPRVAKAVSAAVWAFSFIVVLPVVIFSDVQDMFNSCNMSWPEPRDVWSMAFILYTATLGFFGPLLVICMCYLLIIVKVKSSWSPGGIYEAQTLRAEGDPHGSGDRGGVCPLLAAVLHHQHRKPGVHTPGEQRDGRGVFFCRYPVVCKQLRQSAALRVLVRQLQAEFPHGAVCAQGKRSGGWRSQYAADGENDDPRYLPDASERWL